MKYYKFGSLSVSIESKSSTFEFLKNEFSIVEVKNEGFIDLNIIEVNTLPERTGFVQAGQLKAGESFLYAEQSHFKYLFEIESNQHTLYVQLKPKNIKRKYLPAIVGEFLELSNLKFEELVAKSIIYGCLDFIFQQIQIKKAQTFIHASSVVKDNQLLAFLAWGGVGKTTALLKLMNNNEYSFLSDDLAIIDKSGVTYRNPKKMQIYAYNMEGEYWLEKLVLQNCGLVDRLFWKARLRLFGKNRVRRRVFPEEIFKDIKRKSLGKISTAIYLERTDSVEFRLVEQDNQYIAKKAAYVLVEELKPFSTLSSFYKSTYPEGTLILSVEELVAKSEKIINEWLEHANQAKTLYIPENSSPAELYDFLKKNIL